MKRSSKTAVIALAFALWSRVMFAQAVTVWALPNFSDRVEVRVANPGGTALRTLAVVDIAQARRLAPGFPGMLAIVAEQNGRTRFLPSQVDAGSRGESAGALLFPVSLMPHEQKRLEIYYSGTLRETIPWPKRVHAAHSYGYNRATAAIESGLIGYRTYGGFFFDVQAHEKNQFGLFNSLIGYASIASPPAEGQDVIHLGDTLGLGGLFLRAEDKAFRPPMNVPDYAHRPVGPQEPQYRVLTDGPLRALVEADLPRWSVGPDEVAVRAVYEMREGEEAVRCHVWITPLHLSRSYLAGAGLRDLPGMQRVEQSGVMALDGVQESTVGRVGLGLGYPVRESHRAGELKTPDGSNEIVLFDKLLTSNSALSEAYEIAAAWRGSGWANPSRHVAQVLSQTKWEPEVTLLRHEATPRPGRLESEPK